MSRTNCKPVTLRRNAMATEFSITIAHQDQRYARQAAAEAWYELDRLENLLSRYANGSDVSRISRSAAGSLLALDCDTYDCLQIALQIESDTDGAFNIAYGHQPPRRSASLLRLSTLPPAVRVLADQVALDLGGIGKGFALDRMAALLQQWDLPCFLLSASGSTHLAGAPPPAASGWLLQFGPASDRQRLSLRFAALSASGVAVKGDHIRDPQTGKGAIHFQTTWAGAKTAAHADALSTAMMVMNEYAIRDLLVRFPNTLAYTLPGNSDRVRQLHRTPTDVYQ